MTGAKTQVVKAKVKDLIHADWNYKTDGTEEQIETLMAAVEEAGSCGVLMVREVKKAGQTKLEVMDGNHRLTAIKRLSWEDVTIENFGPIDQATAIVLTRQRNEQWFEDDKLKLAHLFNDHVFSVYKKEHLAKILPESLEQINSYEELAKVDWTTPEEQSPPDEMPVDMSLKTIKVTVEEEVFNLWEKWLDRSKEVVGIDKPARALEFAIIEALNVHEDELQAMGEL